MYLKRIQNVAGKEAHFISSVGICSSVQQALDKWDGITKVACYEQRGCSTESTRINISLSLVHISKIGSVQAQLCQNPLKLWKIGRSCMTGAKDNAM
jgi:hypothetical protein